MLDRYQKNRDRMQNKPKNEPEPAVDENESTEKTQTSSENETETDVIEHALQKRRNKLAALLDKNGVGYCAGHCNRVFL